MVSHIRLWPSLRTLGTLISSSVKFLTSLKKHLLKALQVFKNCFFILGLNFGLFQILFFFAPFNSNMVKLNLGLRNILNSLGKTRDAPAYTDDTTNDDFDSVFEHPRKERLLRLAEAVKKTILERIIPRSTKFVAFGNESLMEVSSDLLNNLASELVYLGEQEPYGVMGGTLILNFGSIVKERSTKGAEIESPKFIKIGNFPLEEKLVSTYELHLTLFPCNKFKHKVENLIRKLRGKPAKIMVCERFTLTKKKLYRTPYLAK